MVHLLEPTHNARFVALMDGAMPQWRIVGSSSIACRSGTTNGLIDAGCCSWMT